MYPHLEIGSFDRQAGDWQSQTAISIGVIGFFQESRQQ
jgi:hypothetical protein